MTPTGGKSSGLNNLPTPKQKTNIGEIVTAAMRANRKPCFASKTTIYPSKLVFSAGELCGDTENVVPNMDTKAWGKASSFTVSGLPRGMWADPASGALRGVVLHCCKAQEQPASTASTSSAAHSSSNGAAKQQVFMCTVQATNANGSARGTFAITVRNQELGRQSAQFLGPTYHNGAHFLKQDYVSPSLPTAEVRANFANALSALQRGTFDFDSVRDAKAGADGLQSYSGMVFSNILQENKSSENIAVLHVLQALASIQVAHREQQDSARELLKSAVLHLNSYRTTKATASTTTSTSVNCAIESKEPDHTGEWDPLYLLAVVRLIRALGELEIGSLEEASVLIASIGCAVRKVPRCDTRTMLTALHHQLLAACTLTAAKCWIVDEDLAEIAFEQQQQPPDATKTVKTKSSATAPAAATRSTGGPQQTQTSSKIAESPAEEAWKALEKQFTSTLRAELAKEMKELFYLVGMEQVKMQAVRMCRKAVQDDRLAKGLRIDATLNFVLLGKLSVVVLCLSFGDIILSGKLLFSFTQAIPGQARPQ